jgi:PAS domain-containing protein
VKNLLKSWPNDRKGMRAGQEPPPADDAARRLALFADIERSVSGWFWATDPAGCLSYISPAACERFGVAAEAIIGQPFISLFGTDPDNPGERSDRPLQFQIGAHARLGDVIVRLAPDRCGAGARPAWWALSGTPKLDETGAFVGYRGTARDVTQEYERRIEDSRLAGLSGFPCVAGHNG